MKIKTIEITNYKAFYGAYTFEIGGKNLFLYGENGSGKSSLYYALKDFFQSSVEAIDLAGVENIFVADDQRGTGAIRVTFKPDRDGVDEIQTNELTVAGKDTNTEICLRDANGLKSFLTYKHLLDIHHIKKGGQINLFNLLVKGVLKHFKSFLGGGYELGELWHEIEETVLRTTDKAFTQTQKRKELTDKLKVFNDAFSQLFKEPTDIEPNPDYILAHARPILKLFGHRIGIDLGYRQARPNADLTAIERAEVYTELTYAGRKVDEPHLFLNEARLSAIAISIYLGMIKRHPQGIPYKILFLDDIFIGLDISNRLPLLKILSEQFPEYQIFITTYDKPWYEYAKSFLDGNGSWKTMELYARETEAGFDIPHLEPNPEFLTRATHYLNNSDYKCAAVYARTAFESIIQKHCEEQKLPVKYHKKAKNYSSEDFWNAIKQENKFAITSTVVADVERFRELVLNAFSHYNTEKHEFKTELTAAIDVIKQLKIELEAIRSRRP